MCTKYDANCAPNIMQIVIKKWIFCATACRKMVQIRWYKGAGTKIQKYLVGTTLKEII